MNIKTLVLIKVTLSFILALGAVASIAQAGIRLGAQRATTDQWHWTNEEWVGNDTAYRSIRKVIDNDFSHDLLTSSSINTYNDLYKQRHNDPLSLFRWAYASFQATQRNPLIPQKNVIAPGAFKEAPSPQSYEYARLRFLVSAHYSPNFHLQSIGERLLRHNYEDNDVKYYLIQCYRPWQSPLEKDKALTLANDMVRSEPNRPGSYSALGGIYFSSWIVNRRKEDADQAITAYQEYLHYAPTNFEWRKQAEKTIQYIRSHTAT